MRGRRPKGRHRRRGRRYDLSRGREEGRRPRWLDGTPASPSTGVSTCRGAMQPKRLLMNYGDTLDPNLEMCQTAVRQLSD